MANWVLVVCTLDRFREDFDISFIDIFCREHSKISCSSTHCGSHPGTGYASKNPISEFFVTWNPRLAKKKKRKMEFVSYEFLLQYYNYFFRRLLGGEREKVLHVFLQIVCLK